MKRLLSVLFLLFLLSFEDNPGAMTSKSRGSERNAELLTAWIKDEIVTFPGNPRFFAGHVQSTVSPPLLAGGVCDGRSSKVGLHHHDLSFFQYVTFNGAKVYTRLREWRADCKSLFEMPTDWKSKKSNAIDAFNQRFLPIISGNSWKNQPHSSGSHCLRFQLMKDLTNSRSFPRKDFITTRLYADECHSSFSPALVSAKYYIRPNGANS
jgi:hypothetical protein